MASKIKPAGTRAKPIDRSTITEEQRAQITAALEFVEPKVDVEVLAATAEPIDDNDVEMVLTELKEITDTIRIWGAGEGKKRYEVVKKEAAAALEDGNRYFLDENGVKYFAVRQQSHPVEVDLDLLLQVFEEHPELFEDNPGLLDVIAPRSVSIPAFRAAVATGRIDRDTAVQVARIKENAPWVRFYEAL